MSAIKGSCHCGAVTFQVEAELKGLGQCNCSICRRKGAKLWLVPKTSFTLLSGQDNLTLYQFHTKTAKHYFCKTCGIFAYGQTRRSAETYAINSGCLEGVDLSQLPVQQFDGQSLP